MAEAEKTKEDVGSYPYIASEDSVTTLPEKTMDDPNGRRLGSKKRMVQVACICLLLLLLITIAFILILLFVPTRQIVINNTTHRVVGDRTVDEVEYRDNEESLMEYVLNKNGEQIFVILDLNRNLEIMKISTDSGGKACVVSPILALDPKFTTGDNGTNNGTTDMDINNNSTNQSAVVNFKRSSNPIRDISILGRKGVALCKNNEVYWSMPQCGRGNNENQPGNPPDGRRGRKRRSSWSIWCRWDWNNCFNFWFPDTMQRTYYRCAVVCTWEWY